MGLITLIRLKTKERDLRRLTKAMMHSSIAIAAAEPATAVTAATVVSLLETTHVNIISSYVGFISLSDRNKH